MVAATLSPTDRRKRDALIQANLGLARKIAHRFAVRTNMDYEEIESSAMIGLIKAIDRFDESRGKAFSSFAVPYIQGEILKYLRDTSLVPRSIQELFWRGRKLAKVQGLPIDSPEIAKALHLPERKWQLARELMRYNLTRTPDARLYQMLEEYEVIPRITLWNQQKAEQVRDVICLFTYHGIATKYEIATTLKMSEAIVSNVSKGWRKGRSPGDRGARCECGRLFSRREIRSRGQRHYCEYCKKTKYIEVL